MKTQEKGHTVVLTDINADAAAFVAAVNDTYAKHSDKNIVIDLTGQNGLSLDDALAFLSLSNKHRMSKKSFVLVIKDFDVDDAPEELVIVPTVQEAHDVIAFEEIERDLGF